MLKLLLDEHISPDVSESLIRRQKAVSILCLAAWEGGRFLGASDALILEAAARQKLTLVTYDRKTIPPLLKVWIETGRDHGGILFVDEKTIAPSDIGGLIRALQEFTSQHSAADMTNAVFFLQRRAG